MKSVLVLALLACITPNVAFAGDPAAPAAPANRIVARVAATPVTMYDVDRELQRLLPMQSESFHGNLSEEKQKALRETATVAAIEKTLKALGAEADGITIDEAAVNADVDKVASRFKKPGELEKALAGEPIEEYRASIRRGLLAKRGEELAVDKKVAVTDEELHRWYDGNQAKYKTERMYKVSEIRFGVDPAGNDADRDTAHRKAVEVEAKAKSGGDFYDLAYYNSTDPTKFVGGDKGWIRLGQSEPEYDEALSHLRPGDLSEVIHTIYGFHILKLVEIQEPRVMTFDELKDTIRGIIQKDRHEVAYAAWMTRLKAKFPVKRS